MFAQAAFVAARYDVCVDTSVNTISPRRIDNELASRYQRDFSNGRRGCGTAESQRRDAAQTFLRRSSGPISKNVRGTHGYDARKALHSRSSKNCDCARVSRASRSAQSLGLPRSLRSNSFVHGKCDDRACDPSGRISANGFVRRTWRGRWPGVRAARNWTRDGFIRRSAERACLLQLKAPRSQKRSPCPAGCGS